ncbi:hypothetical protein VIGAN_07096900 [Vigna angularis var. angularis]|uniref:Uncharacterized protein n=1 Tax=Vigna angularis var. angularis TaxID=157739 RepID=A0A0S3SHI4_PHAAN|nr:hypothetical protein VIGAN_07096900 [Vigna angularis var. angularis]
MTRYYMHEIKMLLCLVMFVFVVASIMETSLAEGRRDYPLNDIGRSRRRVDIGGDMKTLGTLAGLLPKGLVPPSAPSPDIN